jgi:hypothetical protein
VAEFLDDRGVEWGYEMPVEYDDGTPIHYLPDFTIHEAAPELDLPRWVEVKPEEALHALRESCRLRPEDCDGVRIEMTSDDIKARGIDELWKPKKLTEVLAPDAVLVVSRVNRCRTMSVLMEWDAITFSKSQPFVNWLTVERERERAEREAEWRNQEALRSQQRQAEMEVRRRTARSQRESLIQWQGHRSNIYGGACFVCGWRVDSYDGLVFKVDGGYIVSHENC